MALRLTRQPASSPHPVSHALVVCLLVGALPYNGGALTQALELDEGANDHRSAWSYQPIQAVETSPPALALDPLADQSAIGGPQSASRGVRSYTVQRGDTLWSVARRFRLRTETLIWANDLGESDLLLIGTELVIPPADGVLHRVNPSDTVAELAWYYGSDVEEAIRVNALEPPYIIVVGRKLLLPNGRMPSQAARNPGAEPQATEEQAVAHNSAPTVGEVVAAARTSLPRPFGATAEQASFILSAAQAARASQRETGVPASTTIAQAILETFWGSSRLARESNNYFGIKAKERPGPAGVVWLDVWEVVGGVNVTRPEPFRAYNTVEESFIDHGRFFRRNSRYAAALAARYDPKQFAHEISRAGYATDPGYATKLIGLMDRFNLYAYDQA